MKIGIIGSGSFGTALAHVLAHNEHDVLLYSRNEHIVQTINTEHRNPNYLPNAVLHSRVVATAQLSEATARETVILAVPSHAMRRVVEQALPYVLPSTSFIHVAKGMEQHSNLRMSEVIEEVCKKHEKVIPLAILSGPSHAEEIIRNVPTVLSVGSAHRSFRTFVQQLFRNEWFRVYETEDIVGMELGGTLKNIIALAAGIMDGITCGNSAKYGDNTKAALITRGLAEIIRFGVSKGARPETFIGLTGLGDLMVTANSSHSRNWKTGYRIGRGETLEAILQDSHMIAEGVKAVQVVYPYARLHNISMPITEAVYKVLFQDKDPKQTVSELMLRKEKEEWSV